MATFNKSQMMCKLCISNMVHLNFDQKEISLLGSYLGLISTKKERILGVL